ncbi:MAG: hypothetical protein ABI867_27615 [Kofleriaceae bacterium]
MWIVIAALAACTSTSPDEATAKSPTVPVGAFTSLPKADWPCARREIDTFGKPGTDPVVKVSRFRYGKADSCLLPFETITEGVVGCVERIEAFTPITVTYDSSHLVALAMYTADWSGDAVHEVGHKVSVVDKRLECHRGDGSLHSRTQLDSSNRPTHVDIFSKAANGADPMQVDYTWQGRRLASVELKSDSSTTTRNEMIYDCSTL